jgi:hypothetical protein
MQGVEDFLSFCFKLPTKRKKTLALFNGADGGMDCGDAAVAPAGANA